MSRIWKSGRACPKSRSDVHDNAVMFIVSAFWGADVAYWDVVAGLATPPDLSWFPAAIAEQGRPDLDRALLLERRDSFPREALQNLA